jgi:hypothetical protein
MNINNLALRGMSVVNVVIEEMRNKPIPDSNVATRVGGNLFMQIIGESIPILGYRVMINGQTTPPIEKFQGWYKNSLEKANRLSEQVMLSRKDIAMPEQISAWQSRVFENKIYGGGIIGILPNTEISVAITFSGFSEHDDEYLCTETGFRIGIISYQRAVEILDISTNPWLLRFQRRH